MKPPNPTARPIPPTRHGAAATAGLPRLVHFWQLHSAFQAHTEPAPCPLSQGLKYSGYSRTVDNRIISLQNADLRVAGLWTIQLLCWRLQTCGQRSPILSLPNLRQPCGWAVPCAAGVMGASWPSSSSGGLKTTTAGYGAKKTHTQKARSDL